jgi:hypothetical protein
VSAAEVPPRLHFYRAFRAAMSEYLKATVAYREIVQMHKELHPYDPVLADGMAGVDVRLKVAMGDQKFYSQEAIMYALAYLVEAEAQRTERVYREVPDVGV